MPAAAKWLAVLVATATFANFAQAQDSPNRKEMKRAPISPAPRWRSFSRPPNTSRAR